MYDRTIALLYTPCKPYRVIGSLHIVLQFLGSSSALHRDIGATNYLGIEHSK